MLHLLFKVFEKNIEYTKKKQIYPINIVVLNLFRSFWLKNNNKPIIVAAAAVW